jgi:hypothetical protein
MASDQNNPETIITETHHHSDRTETDNERKRLRKRNRQRTNTNRNNGMSDGIGAMCDEFNDSDDLEVSAVSETGRDCVGQLLV